MGVRMSANQKLTLALAALEQQLETLKTLTDANEFMVTALKEQGEDLRQMEADAARDMLRGQARARFDAEDGTAPDAAVLAILEQSLGTGLGAQIIPLPIAATKQQA